MNPTIRCDWCHNVLEPAAAIAYWPQGRPQDARFVCRPAPDNAELRSTFACFRQAVGSRHVHAIAPAHQVIRP
jgi:hypothetical protein